ncbi:hypothetical protein ACJZ2D_006386 [Fusarium nematophilum]
MAQSPPLSDIRVLEFAGLAPGPFAGMLCADWGASVLRVDRPAPLGSPPSKDLLARRKASVQIDLKATDGLSIIKDIIRKVDVVIDPFRPGVLEKHGLGPQELLSINPGLVIARMTGFRRDGKYSRMAGHDINYIAVSGVLSMLGASDAPPMPPMNLLGDFAGGGLVCFLGVVLALLARTRTGRGQVVEANMVDGSAFIATSPRLNLKTPLWANPRGMNLLDGGCPYYATYETSDGSYMAVGSLEPQFFAILTEKLSPYGFKVHGSRDDRTGWPQMRNQLTRIFKSRTREEWESTFDATDACVTPVLTQQELEASGYEQRPIVMLSQSPSLTVKPGGHSPDVEDSDDAKWVDDGWESRPLKPGQGGDEILLSWMGWHRGQDYRHTDRGIVKGSRHVNKL